MLWRKEIDEFIKRKGERHSCSDVDTFWPINFPFFPLIHCQARSKYKHGPLLVEASWNMLAHAQKPDFVFRAKRTSPFKSPPLGGVQLSRLLVAEVCESAVIMLDTPCSEVVWRVLATHSIRQVPLHFPLPCVTVPSHLDWSLLYFWIVLSKMDIKCVVNILAKWVHKNS